ncbi:MAG: transcriptional repressor [Planctomycetota bacterium]
MQSAREVFHDHGLRCTRQREAIYDALRMTDAHPTAEELFESVRTGEEGLSLATIYNTLDAFVRTGLARVTRCGAGPCRYDADVRDHVHLICPDGRVMDVPASLSREVLDRLPADLLDRVADESGVGGRVLRVLLEVSPSADGAHT